MTSLMNTLKGLVFGLAVAAIPATGFAGYSNSVSCNAAEDWKKSDLSPFACTGSYEVGTLQPATMLDLVFESFKTETGLGEWTLTGFANARSKEKQNNVFDKVQRSKSGEIKLEDKLNSTFVMALFADESSACICSIARRNRSTSSSFRPTVSPWTARVRPISWTASRCMSSARPSRRST